MSDLGEDYRAVREASKQRRGHNRERGADLLREAGVAFTTHNTGAHLIVLERLDFFPGTGLWSDRKSARNGRGVRGLLAFIKELTS